MKIICIGQNYIDHIRELGNEIPETPVIFLKPDSALLRNNQPFYYPEFTKELHYELEIVIRINRLGKHIEKRFAHKYYEELTVGIDMTARDLQREARKKGLPWEISKAFDNSAVLGEMVRKDDYPEIKNLSFFLNKNELRMQTGNTRDMIFDFDAIVSYVSRFFTLKIGDLIYTGTPVGVGCLNIGDKLDAGIEGQRLLNFEIK
jgi:acylpyruvate hydrolase